MNIGDTLPYKIKVAPVAGGITKNVKSIWVADANGIMRKVKSIFIAEADGQINKRVLIGGGRLGDVNNDGTISVSDYTLIRLHWMGTRTLTPEEFYRADVNQDGIVNETDSNMVQAYILGGGT